LEASSVGIESSTAPVFQTRSASTRIVFRDLRLISLMNASRDSAQTTRKLLPSYATPTVSGSFFVQKKSHSASEIVNGPVTLPASS